MDTISDYICRIHNLLSNGEIVLEDTKSKIEEYRFYSDTHEIYFNVYLESISIFEYFNDRRRCVLYLDKNNANRGYCHYNTYSFYNLYELMVNICVDEDDITEFEEEMELLVAEEKYERATKLRDIINEIKEIINY